MYEPWCNSSSMLGYNGLLRDIIGIEKENL